MVEDDIRSQTALVLHWRHCSLRGPVQQRFTDVLMISQLLQEMPVAMNQAPSKGTCGRTSSPPIHRFSLWVIPFAVENKYPMPLMVAPDLLLQPIFEGSVGLINEHNSCLLCGLWEDFSNPTRANVTTQLLLLNIASVNTGMIEFCQGQELQRKIRDHLINPLPWTQHHWQLPKYETLDHSTRRNLDFLHANGPRSRTLLHQEAQREPPRDSLSTVLWKLALRGPQLRCRQKLSTRTEKP